jgi:hypothetical protein
MAMVNGKSNLSNEINLLNYLRANITVGLRGYLLIPG